MDFDELGEKIISNIDCQFETDKDIDEYDILPPIEEPANRNPVFIVDHKMAIESWAARLVLCTAQESLHTWRNSSIAAAKFSSEESSRVVSTTRALLLITADNKTAWNIRKELHIMNQLNIKDDLILCDLILKKHPKSSEVYAHRRWLLSRLLTRADRSVVVCVNPTIDKSCTNDNHLPDSTSSTDSVDCPECPSCHNNSQPHTDELHTVVSHEMDICHLAADRYHSNYHAWSHRMWVMNRCACCTYQRVLDELKRMRLFVLSHVSDHSGFHYRQFLLSQLATLNQTQFNLHLSAELTLTCELIDSYPGHEAIWYHRRFVVHRLFRNQVAASSNDPEEADQCEELSIAVKKSRRGSNSNSLSVIESEEAFCREMLGSPTAGRLHWNSTLAKRHLDWTGRLVRPAVQHLDSAS